MIPESVRAKLSKTNDRILKVAAVVGAITIIAGGYSWYLNNVWKPTVKVTSVDFTKGVAEIEYRGHKIDLEGDAVYWLNGDWGIKFGSIRDTSGNVYYDRIELLKKGMVVEYLKR
jgi:hypothetical protein